MAAPSDDLYVLPADLPIPVDDGAADHLPGAALPALRLPAIGGGLVDLSQAGRTVFFFYPRTGTPGEPVGQDWDRIPGARGCTPQSCAFRDLFAEFSSLGVAVYGVSTQVPAYQQDFARRNHLPYELLSDAELRLTTALRLPVFDYPVRGGGPRTLIRRMAWYAEEGRIVRVFYPVFPPDRNAATVLAWLRAPGHSG